MGETLRNIHVSYNEHRRDSRVGKLDNALLLHISKSNRNFDFNTAIVLAYIHNKRPRQILEAGTISFC